MLETKTGTATKAMAWVLPIMSDIKGTASKGKPTPNVPLTRPPNRMARAQAAMISTPSGLKENSMSGSFLKN
jgi:hypothetical protein